MSDVIQIRGLRVVARHGVLDFEKERAQPFEVDLDLVVDLRQAGQTDGLEDTVNYGAVSERVAEVILAEQNELLERVAQRIADAVLAFDKVTSVDLTLRKLRPPVPVDMDFAGVRIVRP